ncbi:helix-hairpin-helix domain-containing protein [Streptomyces sp. SAI-229]|uniref:helix-hairpin-helix domain-containing protein n=1 Tax=Streptomyces sp. SAI-229 TaxID=3377731 RepID=UPI003C7B7DDE
MALRSRSRTGTATSGPGRPPASDGRARHRRPAEPRGRAPRRDRRAAEEELRRRAESLFDGDDHAAHGRRPPAWALTGTRRIARAGSSAAGNRPGAVDRAGGAGRGAAADRVPDRGRSAAVEHQGAGGHATMAGNRAVDTGRPGAGDRWADVGRPVVPERSVEPGRSAAADRQAAQGRPTAAGGFLAAGPSGGAVVVDDEGGTTNPEEAGGASARGRRERAGLALRERLPLWVQTRCGMERRSVAALSVLLVIAVGFAVQHFWTGRTQPVRAPEVVRAAAVPYGEHVRDAVKGEAVPDGAVRPGGPGPAGTEIVVDVSGKVRNPGIHRLPAGSRVEDALRAAGGVRPGTRTDTLNRARFLVDGEQVVVGGPAPAAAAPGSGTGTAAGAGPTAPVSLSTATLDQLDALPGVGPVLAQHIIDHRTRNGGFRSVDELREVNGIGDRRFAELRNLVRP